MSNFFEIPIKGKIDSYFYELSFRENFQILNERRKEIKNVLLNISCTGGDAASTEQIYNEIEDFKNKNPEIKFTSFVYDKACSAGYQLALVSGKIYGNLFQKNNLKVGSIGVARLTSDAKNPEEYSIYAASSHENKLINYPFYSLSEEQKNELKEEVDQLASVFFQLVSEKRSISVDSVKNFQAKYFNGETALELGLIDGLLSYQELKSSLVEPKEELKSEFVNIENNPDHIDYLTKARMFILENKLNELSKI